MCSFFISSSSVSGGDRIALFFFFPERSLFCWDLMYCLLFMTHDSLLRSMKGLNERRLLCLAGSTEMSVGFLHHRALLSFIHLWSSSWESSLFTIRFLCERKRLIQEANGKEDEKREGIFFPCQRYTNITRMFSERSCRSVTAFLLGTKHIEKQLDKKGNSLTRCVKERKRGMCMFTFAR